MTINIADNTPRVSYSVAEGVTQTSFTVSFEFFDDEDLNVYVDGTLKTLTTDYTVSGGGGTTGTVTISVTGGTGGSTVVITRDIELERTTDFPASGAFQINSLNTELDRITAIAADLNDLADRGLRLKDQDDAVSTELPLKADRVGRVLGFNATTGVPEAGPLLTDVSSLASITADIATLADIEDGTDATDAIQTVAGISSNVTTVAGISSNVTTVAGISADVTSVAADATDIGTVATNIASVNTVAGNISEVIAVANDLNEAVSEVETVANDLNEAVSEIETVAASITNVDTVGTNISNVNTVAGNSTNINTVAGISSNVTTVAGISGNVTTVAGISGDVTAVAADATDIGTVSSNIANVNTVAGNTTNINTVAGISANVTTVAGISANVTTVAGISSDVIAVAADATDIGTVATNIANVNSVGGSISNVNTVASNLSSVNDFADKYRIGASDPTTDNDEGDLFYNTTTDTLKVYTGSAWEQGVTAGSGFLPTTGGSITGNIDVTGTVTADGLDLGATTDASTVSTIPSDYQIQLGSANSTTGDIGRNISFETGGVVTAAINSYDAGASSSTGLAFFTGTASTLRRFLDIKSNGDVSLYDSSGVSQGFFWDADQQRLGLGSTGPTQTLDVNGNARVDGAIYLTDRIYHDGDTNTSIRFPAADTISLNTAGQERVYITSGGSVGIGTTGPSNTLHINDASNSTPLRVESGQIGSYIQFENSTASDGYIGYVNSELRFWTNNSQKAVITSGGDVGIGTSSPSANLHAKNASANLEIRLDSDSARNIVFADNDGTYDAQIEAQANGTLFIATRQAQPMLFAINNSEKMRIDSSGNVGIGTSSPSTFLHIDNGGASGSGQVDAVRLHNPGTTAGDGAGIKFSAGTSTTGAGIFGIGQALNSCNLVFRTGGDTERMRIDSSGVMTVNNYDMTDTTPWDNSGANSQGISFGAIGGLIASARPGGDPAAFNRTVNDGTIVFFYQDGTIEGSISVAGTTVSYNGGHLSRYSQTSNSSRDTSIVKGTVLTNLNTMCEWKQATFTTASGQDKKVSYDGNSAAGETVIIQYNDQDVSATVEIEDNEQLNRMAVSLVEGDANVAGVFVNWDEDTNDMNVAMTGDFVIRIASGTTVAQGNLLMSAGDGTAKPQDDDIVRSKTIAKVTSTHVSHTYDDGSYLVPCVLMAC